MPVQWCCVSGKLNPADIGSSGLSMEVVDKLKPWLYGPHFLYKEESERPSNVCLPDVKPNEFCAKCNRVHVFDDAVVQTVRVEIFERSGLECLIVQYSNWLRLIRSVA